MLVHSLWIGLLTASLAGLVMAATRRTAAQLRYQLLCAVLMIFTGLMGVVFYLECSVRGGGHHLGKAPLASVLFPHSPAQDSAIEHGLTIERLIQFVNQQSGWIFTIWLLVFVVKSLQLTGGVYYIHRIRSHNASPLSQEWSDRVKVFAETLGIRRPVALRQSKWVNIPVTVGLFRPVIVLPFSLIFQLPPEQIEAILWHELAHIRRRDYLMNLLQTGLEAFFFFNPGLLWISSLIREEREICCDSLALAQLPGKNAYVEALLAFQDVRPASAALLGLGGHPLVNRLRRMVTMENRRMNWREQFALAAGLFLILALLMISRPASNVTQYSAPLASAKPTVAPVRLVVTRRTPGLSRKHPPATRIPARPERRPSPAVPSEPAITPEPSISTDRNFTSIRFIDSNQDKANREMIVQDDRGNHYYLKVTNRQLVALAVNEVAVPETDLVRHQPLLRLIEEAFAEKQRQKQQVLAVLKASAEAERQQQATQEQEARQAKEDFLQQSRAELRNE